MRIDAIAALVALSLASEAPASTPGGATAALPGWMAGAWSEVRGEAWTEEYWTPPRAGLMLGAARNGTGETLKGWEASRIELDGRGVPTFVAAPDGAPPTRFPMVRAGPAEIMFANPAHDYPQRIRYWREGPLLKAEIAMADGSRPIRWTYRPIGD